MARPERFELPTNWFEASYSIQLSYERVESGLYLPFSNPSPGCWQLPTVILQAGQNPQAKKEALKMKRPVMRQALWGRTGLPGC